MLKFMLSDKGNESIREYDNKTKKLVNEMNADRGTVEGFLEAYNKAEKAGIKLNSIEELDNYTMSL